MDETVLDLDLNWDPDNNQFNGGANCISSLDTHMYGQLWVSNHLTVNDVSAAALTVVGGNLDVDTGTLSVYGHSTLADVSANDARFLDISANNFFSTSNSSFYGNIHSQGHSTFNDVSANDLDVIDLSAIDLSCVNLFVAGNTNITVGLLADISATNITVKNNLIKLTAGDFLDNGGHRSKFCRQVLLVQIEKMYELI